MPAGHSRPSSASGARAMRTAPPRSPALTRRAASGPPGGSATGPDAASAAVAGFHGAEAVRQRCALGGDAHHQGSDQAETSYGRTTSLPGTSLISG